MASSPFAGYRLNGNYERGPSTSGFKCRLAFRRRLKHWLAAGIAQRKKKDRSRDPRRHPPRCHCRLHCRHAQVLYPILWWAAKAGLIRRSEVVPAPWGPPSGWIDMRTLNNTTGREPHIQCMTREHFMQKKVIHYCTVINYGEHRAGPKHSAASFEASLFFFFFLFFLVLHCIDQKCRQSTQKTEWS